MDSSPFPSWFDRLIAPRVLILGVVMSFVACCLAGYLTSRRNHIQQFVRFHQLLAPESLYYPTVSQVRELARSRLQPDKIIVIVGGSSILHGTCQPPPQVWTARLQALLGDRYQVLNLAMRVGRPMEIGAIAAEFLERDFHKLLLITDVAPGLMQNAPDGLLFKYFFWDAYYQGLLLPDKARAARLEALLAEAEEAEQKWGRKMAHDLGMLAEAQRELRMEMRLNQSLHYCDLWNTLAYTCFHTLWTPLTYHAFTRPRKSYQDTDWGGLPLEFRYARDNDKILAMVRDHITNKKSVKQDADSRWIPDPESQTWSDLEQAAVTSFPEPTRKRTLMLVPWYSPYYLHQLTTAEQAGYAVLSLGTVRLLEKLGFTALAAGEGYQPIDYGDLVHLTESGGAKMAEAVAPQIRALAERLGYLTEGAGR